MFRDGQSYKGKAVFPICLFDTPAANLGDPLPSTTALLVNYSGLVLIAIFPAIVGARR